MQDNTFSRTSGLIACDDRVSCKLLYNIWISGKIKTLRGKGGVPGGQIMENEFEYLTDRGGYGDHLAEKFLKKYCS